MSEPTPEAARLLEEAAADRRSFLAGQEDGSAKTASTIHLLAAQRSANRRWGVDPQPSGDE